MPATFPAHLSCTPLAGSFATQRRSHYTEFATESGKPLRSKYAGTPLTDVTFQRIYSAASVDDLIDFYDNDCGEGAVTFYMEHPQQRALRVFWWNEPPAVQHVSGDHYLVSFSLAME